MIAQYRKHSFLYNRSDGRWYDRSLRIKAWDSITANVGLSERYLKKRMDHLRSKYAEEKHTNSSTWPLLEKLSFLDQKFGSEDSDSNAGNAPRNVFRSESRNEPIDYSEERRPIIEAGPITSEFDLLENYLKLKCGTLPTDVVGNLKLRIVEILKEAQEADQ